MRKSLIVVCVLCVLSLCGCVMVKNAVFEVGKKRAEKNLFVKYPAKYPDLFSKRITLKDSTFRLEFAFEKTEIDTFVQLRPAADTIYITKERLKIQLIPTRDSNNNITDLQVIAVCDTVTIYVDRVVSIPTFSDVITETVEVRYIPWWMWVVVGLLVLWLVSGVLTELVMAFKTKING